MATTPKIILTLPGGEVRKYGLEMESVRIGRAGDNTVVIADPSLSSHHAVLHRRDDGFEVVDLGSTNGIEFGGRRVFTHMLRHGDELEVGAVRLRFEDPDNAAAVEAAKAAERAAGEAAAAAMMGAGGDVSPAAGGGASPPQFPEAAQRSAEPERLLAAAGSAEDGREETRQKEKRKKNGKADGEKGGCLRAAVLLVLTVLAPLVGMHVRHYTETGGGILAVDILQHVQSGDGPVPAAAAEDESR